MRPNIIPAIASSIKKNKLKSLLESNMLSNVYLLDKEIKTIDDVTFVGGTLWTDMNEHNEMQ